MKYITTAEAAEKWGLSTRMVSHLCLDDRIPGAVQSGRKWLIPEDAERPKNMRGHSAADIHREKIHLAADATYCEHHDPSQLRREDYEICAILNRFLQGDIKEADKMCEFFLEHCPKDYEFVIHCIRYPIAYYLGYVQEIKAYRNIYNHYLISGDYPLTTAFANSYSGETDSRLAFLYVPQNLRIQMLLRIDERSLYDAFQQPVPHLGDLFELHCQMAEEQQNDEVCAYYHALLAAYYSFTHDEESMNYHIEKTLNIIIPRKWYLILAEYAFFFDWHLESYLSQTEREEIQSLSDMILKKYITVGFARFLKEGNTMPTTDMMRVAFQLMMKYSNNEISENLGITLYEVKKIVNSLYDLTGCTKRSEIGNLIIKSLSER